MVKVKWMHLFALSFLVFSGSMRVATAQTSSPQTSLPSKEQVFKDGKSPCRSYRLACSAGGFSLGKGTAKGNRLISDCMAELVLGKTVISSVTGKTVTPPVGGKALACKKNIHHGPGAPTTGMKPTTAQKKPGA